MEIIIEFTYDNGIAEVVGTNQLGWKIPEFDVAKKYLEFEGYDNVVVTAIRKGEQE